MPATDLASATFSASVNFVQPNGNALVPNSPTKTLTFVQVPFVPGAGAKQADRWHLASYSIPPGGQLSLDLAAGTWTALNVTGVIASSGLVTDLNNIQLTGAGTGLARVKALAFQLVDEVSGSTSCRVNGSATSAVSPFTSDLTAAGTSGAWAGSAQWCDPSAAGKAVSAGSKFVVVGNSDTTHTADVIIGVLGSKT